MIGRGIFTARFDSGCIGCEGRIHEGDAVKWADGNVIHAECLVLDEQFQPVRPVCPRCFMEPAASGSCGCGA